MKKQILKKLSSRSLSLLGTCSMLTHSLALAGGSPPAIRCCYSHTPGEPTLALSIVDIPTLFNLSSGEEKVTLYNPNQSFFNKIDSEKLPLQIDRSTEEGNWYRFSFTRSGYEAYFIDGRQFGNSKALLVDPDGKQFDTLQCTYDILKSPFDFQSGGLSSCPKMMPE